MKVVKLLLIGASVFQRNSEGKLTSKRLVVEYAEGFVDYFTRVIWATQLFEGKTFTQAVVNEDKTIPCIIDGGPAGLISDYLNLHRLIDQDTVVFLHLPNPWVTPLLLALRKKAKGLFIYLANDYVKHSEISRQIRGRIYSKMYRFIHELPIRHADGVIVRGELNFRRAYQLNPNILKTIPIGLNSIYHKRAHEPLSNNKIALLYVGKLVEGKGVDILFRVFAELNKRLTDKHISLTIIGTGTKEENLKQLSVSLGLCEKVKFLGFIDDKYELSRLYSEADIVVVPSTYPEAVPRVIDEALLHRTVVIASDLESIRKQFPGGEVILIPPGNSEALTNAMKKMFHEPDFRASVIKAIEKAASEREKWPNASEQHAEFIKRTLAVKL